MKTRAQPSFFRNMNVPISKRLLLSASMVDSGAVVADIGCDHGYLGVYLLREGIAAHVIASDLREHPLASARRNAVRFGVADRMTFVRSDGLSAVPPDAFDTLVCAGMGGDLIQIILQNAPFIKDSRYTLILQPQSGAGDLRKWLFDSGFAIEREQSVREGHVYFAMRVRYTGEKIPYTPGTLFVTPQMLATDCTDYLLWISHSLARTLAGLKKAKHSEEKRRFYEQAYSEVLERMEHGNYAGKDL